MAGGAPKTRDGKPQAAGLLPTNRPVMPPKHPAQSIAPGGISVPGSAAKGVGIGGGGGTGAPVLRTVRGGADALRGLAGLMGRGGSRPGTAPGPAQPPPGGVGNTFEAAAFQAPAYGDGPCPVATPFACSQTAFEFLATNVVHNEDLRVVIVRAILAPFEGKATTPGVHVMPLDRQDPLVPNSNAKTSAFAVPDGQILIVTDIFPFAMTENVGLPGAHETVDPTIFAGNMTFFLLQQNGQQAYPQRTVITSSITGERLVQRGSPFLFDSPDQGRAPITFAAKTWVQACYEVFQPPYPGIVEAVGMRIRGYLINAQLYADVMTRPYTAGG